AAGRVDGGRSTSCGLAELVADDDPTEDGAGNGNPHAGRAVVVLVVGRDVVAGDGEAYGEPADGLQGDAVTSGEADGVPGDGEPLDVGRSDPHPDPRVDDDVPGDGDVRVLSFTPDVNSSARTGRPVAVVVAVVVGDHEPCRRAGRGVDMDGEAGCTLDGVAGHVDVRSG